MDVKEQNRRKPVFALKRDCGNNAASSKSSHKLQGSKLSGEEKVRKTQGTVQSRCLKLPLNKPQQVSNPKTQCDNLICISELKIGEGNLSQQLTEVRNENMLLKTLQHYDTVTIERQDAGDSISETITKCRNEVRALLRNTLTYRDQLQAKLCASEDRLLNTQDPFQHPRQHSRDHNLREREQLSSMISQPSAEQQERNEDLEGHIQLSQAWFNRQVASGQKSNGPMCCYPHYREHQLIQDLRDEACNLQTQKIVKSLAPFTSQNKDIPADGFVLPLTEAVGPVKSETYETVQLEEQQVEQKEEQEDEQLEEQQKPQLDEQLEEVLEEQLEEVLEEKLEEQEDEQLEEQEDEHLEEQGDEQLEEQQEDEQLEEQQEDEQLEEQQEDEQLDEQEEEQLEEQQEGKEDEQLEEQQEEQKDGQMEEQQEEQQNEQMEEQQELQQDKQEDLEQKNPANLCFNDPVQASLETETEEPTNSIKSHVDDPAEESSDEKEKSESPVASENPLVFEEIQKTQEHVFEESLKMLTKTKQNYTFKETIKNLHKGIPAYRCEYLKNPMRSPAVGSKIRNIPPKNPLPGDPTRDGAGSPLNRDATIRKFSHWVINR